MKIRIEFKKCILLSFVLVILLQLVGCDKNLYRKEYYDDINNFITEEAIIDNIIYDKVEGDIVLWLSDIDEAYVTRSFIIQGDNLDLVLKNDILGKIEIGDEITFTSAPRIFWNGYFFPIIQIATADEEILSIEEGYKNLMDSFE